jgi:hypothetical protein
MLNKEVCRQCSVRKKNIADIEQRHKEDNIWAQRHDFDDDWSAGMLLCGLWNLNFGLKEVKDSELLEKCPYYLEHIVNA